MEPRHSSSSRKAAAARTNGRKGGTKSPEVSRWNALRHSLNTTKLSILEGKHLPEYGECVALLTELVESLGPGPLLVEDRLIIDKYICDAWRLRRALRRELSETEKPDGMLSPGMVNVLRYTAVAQRAFEKSYAQIKEIRKNRGVNVSRAAAAAIDADGNEEPAPEPRAAVSNTSTASVEGFATTQTSGHPDREAKPEESSQAPLSAAPTPAPVHPDANNDGIPQDAVHSAAVSEAAQSAPRPPAASVTDASEEEQTNTA